MNIRSSRLLLGLLIVAGAWWTSVGREPSTFTAYAAPTLPQRAQGDFDGDGRPDVALIREVANGSEVAISLSGTASVVYLSARVGSLITEDIDGDGDLDLIAGTPSGQVVAWLNDGHGRFTPRVPNRSNHVSAETVFADALPTDPAALGAAATAFGSRTEGGSALVVIRSGAPGEQLAASRDVLALSSPRAPPASLSFS